MVVKHTLYIVATPIGHRDDVSSRAITVLKGVDRILAEDTRHSGNLLRHHGVLTPTVSLHEHNELQKVDSIIEALRSGESLALISDAGTPLISDPGYRLVRACLQAGLKVSPIPGASALLAALSVSGLPTDAFRFVGFPPTKASARQRWYTALKQDASTLVLYESPHRILASLEDLHQVFGASREMTLVRELTKQFETVLHGSIGHVLEQVKADSNQSRGEFVLVIAGCHEEVASSAIELDALIKSLMDQLPPKAIARCAADLLNVPKQAAYKRVLELKS